MRESGSGQKPTLKQITVSQRCIAPLLTLAHALLHALEALLLPQLRPILQR